MKTFSINAASELLERDRRTITKVLRKVRPDTHENKKPRWRLRKIVDALEAAAVRPESQIGDAGSDITDKLDALYKQFDAAYDAMKAGPDVAKRRTMARKLAPLIAQTDCLLRARDTANGLDPEYVDLRADKVFFLMMRGFETPCEWSQNETWAHLGVRRRADDAA
jgi:hypothetical protein